ncbi:TRAP transporter permease [Desulfosarcina ovata]|uniref:C4-dicarboxylate ABC transporter n=1 Tax=Desulfosarcina ovata subsp. ovata TaxID=2752305 RepID=A0A5K8A6Z7_9BACT|nr:TRAP transporter permease [Desulfosarcina ovata]BBO88226.1 C4-dicarboxylate ABC transporter [Desulfosarcina ovata subsp. ovata]
MNTDKKTSNALDLKAVMALQEKRVFPRFANGTDYAVVIAVSLLLAAFQIWTAGFGVLFALKQRIIHISLLGALTFFLRPVSSRFDTDGEGRRKVFLWDRTFAALMLTSMVYLLWNYEAIQSRAGFPEAWDIGFGLVMIVLLLEMTRRVVGLALPIIACCFLLYAFLGPYMPSMIGHRGYDLERIVAQMYLTTEGIFGVPAGVSATFIYMFILYGAFLEKSGGGIFFIKLAYALTGRMLGGPAKASVFASGLMGSISGSAVANTVTTGAFTIPLMKSVGFRPSFAAAVEASASSGGQLMPPIMGAAAFIMAVFTNIPYKFIMVSAAVPAALYYFAIFISIHFRAKRMGLKPGNAEDLPNARELLKKDWQHIFSLVVLVTLLLMDITPLRAAFWGTLTIIVSCGMRKSTRMSLKSVYEALLLASRNTATVGAACACAGIVVGVVTLTGIGLKFATLIEVLANGNIIIALLMTMVASLILGMGLPTSACYIVLAVLAAPVLTNLGFPVLASHLFIFYFGIISAITPPVALAAYAGSGISGSNPFKTAVTALSLDLSAFFIPYWFIFNPELLLGKGLLANIAVIFISAVGVVALSAMTQGYLVRKLNAAERTIAVLVTFSLLMVDLRWRLLGLGVFGALFVYLKFSAARSREEASGRFVSVEE